MQRVYSHGHSQIEDASIVRKWGNIPNDDGDDKAKREIWT